MGIGNLPRVTSRVAAISPKVVAGNRVMARGKPNTGTMVATVISAMNMKNNPAMARGCLKKVAIPSLTHRAPLRAGTRLSFMQPPPCL